MNCKPRGHFLLTVLVGLLLLGSAGTAVAAVDITIRLPKRTGDGVFQISKVKITLATSGAGLATETLNVFGAQRNLDIGDPMPFPMGGNLVFFYAPPAEPTTRVIEMYLQGFRLSGATTFCQMDPDKYDVNVPMTLNLNTTIQTYRLSGYSAFSLDQCSCSNRRVDNNPVTWIQSPPGATDAGRHGIDIVFVLDRSGSMGGTVEAGLDGSLGEVKLTVMQKAFEQLVIAWQQAGGPVDDRMAVVWFESGVQVDTGGFIRRDAPMTNDWMKLVARVNAQTTAGSTAMGDGISKAIDLWDNLPDPKNDLSVVVLTNGMQNSGKRILPEEDSAAPKKFFYIKSNQYEEVASVCHTMQCIGVGAPSGIPASLLDKISLQTSGKSQQVVNSTQIEQAFLTSLVEVLKGNTMSKLATTSGTLSAGTPTSAPLSLNLDGSVKRAIVVLSWTRTQSSANQNALKIQFTKPDGTPPATIFAQHSDPSFNIQTIELPTDGPFSNPDPWSVKVGRNLGNADVPYNLAVYTVEAEFGSLIRFTKTKYGTGDDIILTAAFSYGGKPLTNQNTDNLTIQVERPLAAVETLLHQMQVSQTVLTTPGSDPDSLLTTPYQRKMHELLKDPGAKLGQLIAPRPDPQLLHLFDDGNPIHGDVAAGDGIYSARYSQTRLPGRYRFKISTEVITPAQPVKRIEERELEVNVLVIDPTESEVNATHIGSNNYRLDIVPADRFGNFLGPGYGQLINITLTGGGSVLPGVVDKRENGTYTVQLTGVTDPRTTRVKVTYAGQPFADATVENLTKPKRPFAFFAGVGRNFPHGSFDAVADSGLSTQFGVEYMFTNRLSVEGTFGYDQFTRPGTDHLNLFRGSGNLKFYTVLGTFQFGVFGGGGVYHFTSSGGSETHGGVNFGGVGEIRLTTTFSLEGTYNFHHVFSGGNTNFSTVQGGVRFRF